MSVKINKLKISKLKPIPGDIQLLFPETIELEISNAFATVSNTLRAVSESWLPVKYLKCDEETFKCEGNLVPPSFLAIRIHAIPIRQDVPLNTKIYLKFEGTGDIRSSLLKHDSKQICDSNHLIYRIERNQYVKLSCECIVSESNSYCNMTSASSYTITPMASFTITTKFETMDIKQIQVLTYKKTDDEREIYTLEYYFIDDKYYVDDKKRNLYYHQEAIKDVCIKEFVELQTVDSFINKSGDRFDSVVLIPQSSLMKSQQLLPMHHRLSFTTHGNINPINLLKNACAYIIRRLEEIRWSYEEFRAIARNVPESQIAHCILWNLKFHPDCTYASLNTLTDLSIPDRIYVVKVNGSTDKLKKCIEECIAQLVNIYRSIIEQLIV